VAWLGLVACAAVIVLAAFILLPGTARSVVTSSVLEFLGVVIAAVVALLAVCIQKSPSPRWRWGKKSNDSPDEDW